MARKLASLVVIDTVTPIENSDRLSVATMRGKGWKVVVGRNDFQPGEAAVYFEIDSALPNEERYAFLRDRCLRKFTSKSGTLLKECLRIKTVKLRGVISQGLLVPLDKFPEIDGGFAGDDVTELLHVEHFDELKAALAPVAGASVSGDSAGSFPSFIPKTDEERIQNLVEYFDTMKERTFEVTVKADGSSVTMFFSPDNCGPDDAFGVCSRNLKLKSQKSNGEAPLPWQMAFKYNVEAKLRQYWEDTGHELALQGELIGPGIQSNRDLLTEHVWRVFRIWNITTQEFVQPHAAEKLCKHIGVPYVTVVANGMPVFQRFKNVDELLLFAEGKTDRGNEREGLVFKTETSPYVSFKAVSNRYLLKED